MPRLLLSIKPEFAEQILSGRKRYEFRRALFCRSDIEIALIYSCAPCRRIVGEFRIGDVISLAPSELWEVTQHQAGIGKSLFDAYFAGKLEAHALKIMSPKRYRVPKDLEKEFGMKRPPQSFCYVN